jgi:transposase
MVLELCAQDPNDVNPVSRVARQLGVGSEALCTWVKQTEGETGKRPGLTTEEQEELKRLRKENRELQRANDIFYKQYRCSSGRSSTADTRGGCLH